ncbi:MAG TPA: YoaK family protein [Xanthobacteraceae bacterium]|jgi:uncharacterized membrane protein YoaK (UPF0700 family)
MTIITPAEEAPAPVPAAMPMLLSFVAGYIDSYTYLALFGLFAAQVTGSFVIAGAELVTRESGVVGKLLAVIAFLVAAALTAALVGFLRHNGQAALPAMLALETALLATFATMILLGPPINGAGDWYGIVAGLFAAMAMGAQSVLVRLLMRGIPQTNVMTGNMTQLSIETTALILAWRRYVREPHTLEGAREFAAVRKRLWLVLSVALGFLVGAAAGAVTFATTGARGALLAVAIVAALALWALVRERQME